MKRLHYLSVFLFLIAMISCNKDQIEKGLRTAIEPVPGTIYVDGANNGGNITCEEVATAAKCTFESSSGRLNYSDYPHGGTVGPITWTTDGIYVNWSSSVPVKLAVIVKGGNTANVYFAGCNECLTSGTALSAPVNPNNGKPYGLSNITFCYSLCETNNECETAFARKTWLPLAHCFLDLDLDSDGTPDFNRWGWTNGPMAEGKSYYDIYAAAGQCDVTKGTLVGRMDVVYSNGTVTVVIGMYPPYTLDETHLYVGNNILPMNNGVYTVAPGQYPYSHDLNAAKADYYTINGLSGNIYIVLHAVVCGF